MRKKQQHLTMPDRPGPGLTTAARPIYPLLDGRAKYATGVGTIKDIIKLPTAGTTIGTWNVRTVFVV